jgi:hypothetical protein
MQNESKDFMMSQPGGDGGQSEVADPILLGDFVVDAYNQYRTHAQELTQDEMVGALPAIAPLGADAHGAPRQDGDARWPESRPRTHGSDPRLGKMAEILLATGQLLAALQAETSKADDARNDTLNTLLTALAALNQQVDETRQGHTEEMVREAACALAERYNACLDLVTETCDDPIAHRLFARIDVDAARDDDHAGTRVRAELSASGTSLEAYLRKLVARSEPGSGMRGKVWDGKSTPALAG